MKTEIHEQARGCAKALSDGKGLEISIIDLTELGSWTDFFVVAGATSITHMRGLLRNLEEHAHLQGIAALRRPQLQEDDEWCLVDYGDFVVHIMSQGARQFYDLESLWHEGQIERLAE
ncbi:MAG: ribosome silencing factor [Spirochaetes bacterium GWD1_61_31]|nr:MAG: ribosome silencing factor [Spirochaetes bacterium GWB1_60_80]OHD30585.1 MAG: ribosome silencing factor [Spirochaetes bacterium GWC1_61_12]OHD34854.1 MAG: ribosome silencing factor [Spirochaetes bacterium GWD1_61_31]OHD46700.1 MAG: ribosome silencing factor [Spirochaetes bacterium GWE1_60_18]OHD60328.1 MAG: ribosome silencing factor [Spirochaetes bacterium GWF1_60_12]